MPNIIRAKHKKKFVMVLLSICFVCAICSIIFGGDKVDTQFAKLPPPEPTDTSQPIPTSQPTLTSMSAPIPTESPLTFDPISLSGFGDSVISINKPDIPAIAQITNLTNQGNFAVTTYDTDGNWIDLLVNEIGVYVGTHLLDATSNEYTARFEIKSEGDWSIDISPLLSAPSLEVPGVFEGEGTEVFLLSGSSPDLAVISGNSEGHYFGVQGYGSHGVDFLVSTIDPYQGQVVMTRDTFVMEVEAVGDWSISISAVPIESSVEPIPIEVPTVSLSNTSGYTGSYDPHGLDRNCSDFAIHVEAQAFYVAAGGPGMDRHDLDRDKDGIACESLP